jgi:hypothetical protein
MSQHRIVGSEAFEPKEYVQIRTFTKRRSSFSNIALALTTGGALLVAGTAVATFIAQMTGSLG